jgi:hypothetical protein
MFRTMFLMLALVAIGGACAVRAQDSAGQKANALAAALDKTKYKKKEKRDVAIEIYIDIRNAPRLLSGPASYSGTYASDESGFEMTINARADGTFTATGTDTIDPQGTRSGHYTISDGRIDGAVATGTKVFDTGERQPLEAVFVERTVSTGKNADHIETVNKSFGIGWVRTNGEWTSRIFLQRE